MTRAGLEKNPGEIAAMFNDVARRYDFMNTLLTGGLVKTWRKSAVRALEIVPGEKILDVAAGTGTSAAAYAAAGAQVVACDIAREMIARGRRRYPGIEFRTADAMNLPFADESFDAVTISYGIRNIPDPKKALGEMLRVTKPGGRLVVCEFSKPVNPLFARLYALFLRRLMPRLSALFSSDAPAYDYLAESIACWYGQREFGSLIREAGWSDVYCKNLTNGIVALHRARKM